MEEVHPDNTMDKRPTMIREHCPSFIIENIDPIIDKVSSLLDEIVFRLFGSYRIPHRLRFKRQKIGAGEYVLGNFSLSSKHTELTRTKPEKFYSKPT